MEQDAEPFWLARCLLRAARQATLATATQGQPFAALVTPACTPDLSVLLFLSSLSEHTRHLRQEPRCALLVQGRPAAANPQTAPRVTISGLAEIVEEPGLRERWLAIHPYGALYAGFADFALWRIRPVSALFVGGFARAARLRQAELLPDNQAVDSIVAAAPGIMAHCNGDHADALNTLARHAGGAGEGWRMVGVDVDGADLAAGEQVVRLAWSRPIASAEAVRNELVLLIRQAQVA